MTKQVVKVGQIKKSINDLIDNVLSAIGKVDKMKIENKMVISSRIDELLKQRSLGKLEFANRLNQNPSVVTKWLSGNHNFTIDTLTEISVDLDITISELFEKKQLITFISINASPYQRLENPNLFLSQPYSKLSMYAEFYNMSNQAMATNEHTLINRNIKIDPFQPSKSSYLELNLNQD